MASLSVDGLVSGLDTTSLISQLISAESASQTRLKVQLSTTKAAADAYREVNTKVDAVRTAAAALRGSRGAWHCRRPLRAAGRRACGRPAPAAS